MAKNKISEYSATAANNTDIGGINIAEGCAPSGINNAIRELMAQLKDQQAGTDGDGFTVGGAFTSSGGAVFSSGTTFSSSVVMSSTVSMTGNNNIGNTTSSTILSGSVTQTSSSVLYLDDAATTSSAPPLSWDGDTNTGIYRPAADTLALVTGGSDRLRVNSTGVVIIGSGEATSTVAGNILRSVNASGTNIAGSNFEINAGNGTGTGGSGSIILKTADVGSSGSTANTLTQRLLVTPKGGVSFGSSSTAYGTAGQVLMSNGDAPPSFGSLLTSGTAVTTTSGTSADFTGIPSTAKRITVMFYGVSLTTTASALLVRIGSGSFESTGYVGGVGLSNSSNAADSFPETTGIYAGGLSNAADTLNGAIVLTNVSGNLWVAHGNTYRNGVTDAGYSIGSAKTTSGVLDRVQVVLNSTGAFDAGTINIMWE
jgi:hypothetical protein